MTVRSLGLVSLLVALAVGGWLLTAQLRETGPTSDRGKQAEAEAASASAGASFQAAVPVLQAYHADHGTYAGATLPPAYGLVVARADATSYCLQTTGAAGVQHLVGPGGSPAPGGC